MSEGDVSLIHDEDQLRRMWQQTEDFSRKKEIRAHMYRLREERLRNLYSAEPPAADGKGCEFTSPQGHVQSFADQSFQSMKSKEVRDAGSPPKEFAYRGQDLKELSNAGWNVESENRTSDDGHTHVKSVHANIEGRYDVQGGVGQFAAVDHNKQTRTEYRDDNSSLKRDETSSNTAAHEQVVRKTDDGTHFSSTTSSSSTSKIQQVSTRHETVPMTDNYDHTYDTNRNEQQLNRNRDYEQSLRKDDYGNGDLVSRKVEYPDDNTRVIVETRCLPDGTRVTSTRREFRAPAQSTRSEQRSQTRTESKYSTQNKSDQTSTSKVTRHSERVSDIVDSQRNVDDYDFKRQIANYTDNNDYSEDQSVRCHETNKRVIDSKTDDNYSQTSRYESKIHKNVLDHKKIDDDNISKRNQYEKDERNVIDRYQTDDVDHLTTRYETNRKVIDRSQTDDVDHSTTRYETNRKVIDLSQTDDVDHSTTRYETNRKVTNRSQTDNVDHSTTQNETKRKVIDRLDTDDDYSRTTRYVTMIEKKIDDSTINDDVRKNQVYENVDDGGRREIIVNRDDRNIQTKDVRDTQYRKNTEERVHSLARDKKDEIIEKKITSDQYQTTYQTDYPQKKISNDWSPSHQAWASTLRSDTPVTRPSTRASSPGSRTFKSSTSSLRSSVSPDKTSKKPLSRGSSPNKVDRFSPTRTVSDRYTSTHSTHSVTETKTIKQADKRPPTGRSPTRPGYSPDRKHHDHPRSSASPEKGPQYLNQRPSASPERKPTYVPTDGCPSSPTRLVGSRQSPERKPGYKPSDDQSKDSTYPRPISPYTASPERNTTDGRVRSPTRPTDMTPGPRQSPEKKPGHKLTDVKPRDSSYPHNISPNRYSPEKNPIDSHPNDFVSPNRSPDTGPRKSVEDRTSPSSNYPRTTSPSRSHPSTDKKRPSVSPDRKPEYQTNDVTHKSPARIIPQRSSASPDRKPGYMRPTASSQPTSSSLRSPSKSPVIPDNNPPSQNLIDDRNSGDHSQIISVKEDHYKFIDEETKMYTQTDKTDMTDKHSVIYDQDNAEPRDKSTLAKKRIPNKDVPVSDDSPLGDQNSLRNAHASFTNERNDTTIIKSKYDITEDVTTKYPSSKDNDCPDSAPKPDSLLTNSTYDKKQQSEDLRNRMPTDKDYLRREQSPSEHKTYEKKKPHPQDRDVPKPHSTPHKESSPTKYGTYDKKQHLDNGNDRISKHKDLSTQEMSPTKDIDNMKEDVPKDKKPPTPKVDRESSPSKYKTDKKQPTNRIEEAILTDAGSLQTCVDEVTTITSTLARDKSPKKFTEPLSPTKKSPKDSFSPAKSPTKDTKYKHTTDFLVTERTTEEINQKTTKSRPRQLVTPSSSPTRKPKPETEPSTGQSSPTTSVSGFVYFGSPRHDDKRIVTNLDDHEFYSETTTETTAATHMTPETLENCPKSPSKTPCRSPSPEKQVIPAKESLPRKSSLKKPSEPHQISPTEKPPSSFRVSPSNEQDLPTHTIIKKDHPEPESRLSDSKPKPPLERRETYEDRCKKMLGMDHYTTETVTQETQYFGKSEQKVHSPSVSPCLSPKASTPFNEKSPKKNTQTDVTDFITQEKDNITKTTARRESYDKPKTSREGSPTKLRDTLSSEKKPIQDPLSNRASPDKPEKQYSKESSPRKTHGSPHRKPDYVKTTTTSVTSKYDTTSMEDVQESVTSTSTKTSTFKSPTRDVPKEKDNKSDHSRTTSPSKTKVSLASSTRNSISPERKSLSPNNNLSTGNPSDNIPEESFPSGLNKTQKSSVTSKHDVISTTEDTKETKSSKTIETEYHKSSKSTSDQILTDNVPKSTLEYLRNTSPSRTINTKDRSPEKKTAYHAPSVPTKDAPPRQHKTNPKDSTPDNSSGYLRTTTSVTSKYDIASNVQKSDKIMIAETEGKKYSTLGHTVDKSTERNPQRNSLPTKETPTKKSGDRHPKDMSPTRPNKNISDTLISAVTSDNDSASKIDNIKTITQTVKRTISPPRSRHPKDDSPDRKSRDHQLSSPTKDLPIKNIEDHYAKLLSPTQSDRSPGYRTTTTAVRSQYDNTEDIQETINVDIDKNVQRHRESPSRLTPGSLEAEYPRPESSTRGSQNPNTKASSQRPFSPTKDGNKKTPRDKSPQKSSSPEPHKTPGYMKTTTATTTKFKTASNAEDMEETFDSNIVEKKLILSRRPESPTEQFPSGHPRSYSTSQPKYLEDDSPSRNSQSPERKNESQHRYTSTIDRSTITHEDKHQKKPSPNKADKIPGYMRTTASITSKHDVIATKEDQEECFTSKISEKHPSSRHPESPTRQMTDHTVSTHKHPGPSLSKSDYPKESSPTRVSQSPERKPEYQHPSSPTKDSLIKRPGDRYPVDSPQSRPNESTGYMKTAVSSKYDTTSTTEDIQETITTKTIEKRHPSSRPTDFLTHQIIKDKHTQAVHVSPSKQQPSDLVKDSNTNKSGEEYPKESTPSKRGSPDTKPGYMKPTASVTSKNESTFTNDIDENVTTETKEKFWLPRSSVSPTRKATAETTKPDHIKKPEESRQLRTPSPIKKTTKVTEVSTDFIMSEREQEVLDRVQKSLRKLSPERKEKSLSRGGSPTKETTSLYDLDITKTIGIEDFSPDDITETPEKVTKVDVSRPKSKEEKTKEQKVSNKPSSRNVSPTKKAGPTKVEKTLESSNKSRSISPKKPFDRPQSPQVPKISGIKAKESTPSHLTRKPTPITITASRLEKSVTADVKKTIGVAKQISITRSTVKTTASKFMQSPTSKTEPETKRAPIAKGIRDTNAPQKDTDIKVTRTVSDITMKYKKSSPQRIKSKPEIQVSDMSTTKPSKTHKPIKESQAKFPGKPKSATALNTSTDEDDDVIIDVQQSKSSRENSPDRICPTPINFSDDVGTPRFPDEVSEPDDEFRKRTHHTIHEAESIVDDIVEICEDDELFTKRTNVEDVSEYDESLFSVHDKVSKFKNKIETVTKPKDSTTIFKETERRIHSDFVNENLKSDECLLSVSEKVNKFAKGPRDIRDCKSPARKIDDEYDKDTIYQDDYTKLSVNDKAHLFVETAENVKVPRIKSSQKVERPDISNVDDSLKSDDCLLSVSDKVNKFVKTAEQFLTETHEVDEKEKRIKEQHDKIMRQIVDDSEDETIDYTEKVNIESFDRHDRKIPDHDDRPGSSARDIALSQAKVKQHSNPNLKSTDKTPTVKITTLRSSEAVKKAKALFENIASTTTKTKETTNITKLTDIGVSKKSPKADNDTVPRQNVEEDYPMLANTDSGMEVAPRAPREHATHGTSNKSRDDKPRNSPSRLTPQPPEMPRSKSPSRHTVETTTTTKTVVTKNVASPRSESPRQRLETDKIDKVPGYLRSTKTSQIKEEKVVEETEVSTRRGSGKFGVELRRTSVERATASTERRRSVEHPCIEDIFDLDLLEQMLEKVVGYEQRRRIRAQIRVAKKEHDSNTITKTIKTTVSIPKSKSPEPHRSPDRTPKSTTHKTASPDRRSSPQKTVNKSKEAPVLNGHPRETIEKTTRTERPHSPEKPTPKVARQPSPDKKTRPQSPSKAVPKSKSNRFNEYASAYMKKVGLNEATKAKIPETKKKTEVQHKSVKQFEAQRTVEQFSTTKSYAERTSSNDVIEIVQVNGKRSPSPEKRQSPERQYSPERKQSPERRERSPSPELKRQKPDTGKKETIIKTVYEIEKKAQPKTVQEEKPSWVTNRNLKKITSETRTFSSKKLEPEKPKYRASSPSKVISKPIDVITSSYGPGPLDADGKPLFGIKALRNGSSNYQVKGTVVRSEFHSRNGGAPSGSVSVTAYSSQPEELERLLQSQGAPPSRLHGLAAITTTRNFGGDTGTTIQQAHGKEERAAIDQFTHSDRRVTDTSIDTVSDTYETLQEITGEMEQTLGETIRTRDEHDIKSVHSTQTEKTDRRKEGRDREERRERMETREDKKTVRQSSVKSLTEKYIKSASETAKSDRSAYPKAGLILRTATVRDSVSSDSSTHAGLARTDSEHSLGSVDDAVVTTTSERIGDGIRTVTTERVGDGIRTTTTTTSSGRQERSFLDSNTKVTGVQDILTRMKNADIVIQEGDTNEDAEARALLNKFLGASVLMAGMQGYVAERPEGKLIVQQETVRTSGGKVTSSRSIEELDLDQCWDERVLRKLLDECTDYEQRRRLRARIRTLMAEQEACTNAVTEALSAAGEATATGDATDGGDTREEEEVTVTSSVRRDSSEKTVSSSTTTKTSKVIESMTRPAPKPVSPFAKFRQLEKQNSTNSPNSPKTPQSPGSPSQPYFKFTDPALQASALTIKERLLQWCRDKTRDYENVKLENFSTSWADGLAFCALLHHFLPNAFDYSRLVPDQRRHNFTLAFKIADEKAGIYPLLDVDDMVAMRKPDWKCVFTYVQSIHRRFKDHD